MNYFSNSSGDLLLPVPSGRYGTQLGEHGNIRELASWLSELTSLSSSARRIFNDRGASMPDLDPFGVNVKHDDLDILTQQESFVDFTGHH
jgi:hypothetical protein